MTLFVDPEDDLFDGELGEDDEDVPRINLTFKLEQAASKRSDLKPQLIEESPEISNSIYKSVTKPRAFRDSDDEVQIQSVVPVPTLNIKQTAQVVKTPLTFTAGDGKNQDGQLSTIFGGTAPPK